MLNQLAISLISGLRPLLGPSSCRYTITCTRYAIMQLEQKEFFDAFKLISMRLFSCYSAIWAIAVIGLVTYFFMN